MIPSAAGSEGGAACSGAVGVADGFASTGVMGVASLACRLSRFFSAVLRNALVVIRNDLLGLQSSAEMGVCSQTGHVEGSDNLPEAVSDSVGPLKKPPQKKRESGRHSQFSQIICSQQGVRKALTASLLQMAQRSLMGTSSCGNELELSVSGGPRWQNTLGANWRRHT